jgi:hypothetical protein
MVLEDVGHSESLFRSEAFDVSKIRWKHILDGSLFCDPYRSVKQDSSEEDEDENTIATFASTPSKGPLATSTINYMGEVVIEVFDSPPRNGRYLNSVLEDASSPKELKAFWTSPGCENSTISYYKGSPSKKTDTITMELSSYAAFNNRKVTARGMKIEVIEKPRGYGSRILFLLTLLSLGIVVYSMPYWGLDAGLAVDHMKRQANRLDEVKKSFSLLEVRLFPNEKTKTAASQCTAHAPSSKHKGEGMSRSQRMDPLDSSLCRKSRRGVALAL